MSVRAEETCAACKAGDHQECLTPVFEHEGAVECCCGGTGGGG